MVESNRQSVTKIIFIVGILEFSVNYLQKVSDFVTLPVVKLCLYLVLELG